MTIRRTQRYEADHEERERTSATAAGAAGQPAAPRDARGQAAVPQGRPRQHFRASDQGRRIWSIVRGGRAEQQQKMEMIWDRFGIYESDDIGIGLESFIYVL